MLGGQNPGIQSFSILPENGAEFHFFILTVPCIAQYLPLPIFVSKYLEMAIENTESQMRKGLLELCILGIIDRQTEAYPSDILEQLKGSKLMVLEGTLYPLLTRLKNAGMLAYRWEESLSGPPRKYYSLTPEGSAFYQELLHTWRELARAVDELTSNPKQEHA
jgi:PadR family transcriptional regulator, regulatory protein PadR